MRRGSVRLRSAPRQRTVKLPTLTTCVDAMLDRLDDKAEERALCLSFAVAMLSLAVLTASAE